MAFGSQSSPISADDLFRWPDTYSYKLNPSSKYLAKHYFRGENYNVIEIQDIKTKKIADAFRIKVKKFARINDYYWIDEDTLYIDYRIGENSNKRIFLDIDYNVFKNSDNEIAKSVEIKSKALIIDPLIYQDNKVLVQKTKSNKVTVYTTTPDKLSKNIFSKKDRFQHPLDSAIGYSTGENGEIQFSVKLDDDKLQFWYLKNYDSEWIKLFEFDGTDDFAFEPVAVLNDHTLAVITNRETDKKALIEYDFVKKEFGKTIYLHEKYDLHSAAISETTGELSLIRYYDHGRLITEYFSLSNKQVDAMIREKFPNKQYYVYSKHAGSTIMVIYVFSSDDPGNYYWLDAKISDFVNLGSSRSYLDKYTFSSTETFTVKSSNNVEIEAILTRPKNANGVLLVSPHGGPIGVRQVDSFDRSNQFFASRGYSILNVNFRGSSGYGKKFLSSGVGQFGKIIEEDISLVVNKVKEKYHFDSMCSMGASYGGYSALILAIYHPDEYKCAVGAYGVYDLPLLFNTSNLQMSKDNIASITKTVGEYNDSLKEFSPFYLSDKINTPILLIAGKDDSVSGFEQSNRMKYRLRQLGKEVETLFYAETGHGHYSLYWEKHQHLITEEFIRRTLQQDLPKNIDRKVFGKEAMIIADGYEFENIVKSDSKKAFNFYKIAADFGDPRGLYNLGSYYHRGEEVDKDMMKAVELYKKSSEKNYMDASFRLGNLYHDDDLGKPIYEQSYHYYVLAKEQGHKKVDLKLMNAICLGRGVDMKLYDCLESLDKQLKTKIITPSNSNGTNEFRDILIVMNTIKDLLFESELSSNKLSRVIELLNMHRFINVPIKSQLKLDDYGTWLHYRTDSNKYRNVDSDTKLNVSYYHKLGIVFEIKNSAATDSDAAIYKVTWHHPPFKKNEKDLSIAKEEYLDWVYFNREVYVLYDFYNKKETRIDGLWKVELHNLNGELLVSKEFDVKFED